MPHPTLTANGAATSLMELVPAVGQRSCPAKLTSTNAPGRLCGLPPPPNDWTLDVAEFRLSVAITGGFRWPEPPDSETPVARTS